MQYRFVSASKAEIGPIELRRFGQKVELTEAQYLDAVAGGCNLIPEADFQGIGFTETELQDYGLPGQQVGAPEDFLLRVELAREVFVSTYQRLHSPGPAADPTPEQAPNPIVSDGD